MHAGTLKGEGPYLVGQHRSNEQNSVRAVLARQVDLVGVHDELLAQQRALHTGRPDQLQVVEAALGVGCATSNV
jgi:hypothetical protein